MLPYINTRMFEILVPEFYPFQPLVDATGASIDELKLIFSFLLSYPLAGILKRIPDSKPWAKDVFIIASSLFYIVGLFDLWEGIRTLFIAAAGTYIIAKYVEGPLMPWLGFAFAMGHMSANHIIRQMIDDPSVVDITGAQMVLVMKLTAFCWNVHDGRQPQEELSEKQKYAALKELPGLLDYAAYVLFFPSLFGGPSFDYMDYHRWIQTTLFDCPPGTDPAKAPRTRKSRKIPRSARPALRKLVEGLAWIFAFLQLSAYFPTDLPLSDEFMTHCFPVRVLLMYAVGFAARSKYYAVWKLTEGACILCGMGYNGFNQETGEVYWNALENVDPWSLETAQNPRAYLGSWNKNTNHWLRNYIYVRVTPKGKKPGFRASMATFGTSAFWHGFYPGYYLTFVLGSLIQTAAKHFRRHVRPFFFTTGENPVPTAKKPIYDVLSWIVTQLTLSFCVAPFITLRFKLSLLVWARLYFFGVIGVVGSLIFFSSGGSKLLKEQLDKRSVRKLRQREEQEQAGCISDKGEPILGLSEDVGQDINEAVQEIGKEISARQRAGSTVEMPTGANLRRAVDEKLKR
ncbi:MBOAT family protein [Ascosphaera apis ARSEF 7405]|uniref:MBOAT family protein n=1 Tax=Ascosphaera apis ARSEF 7405 TaxID=392613 RepID=A0A162IF51_9EURO|nr:MBOAT family protein [Ascosphaera apis ARSEF 7405]